MLNTEDIPWAKMPEWAVCWVEDTRGRPTDCSGWCKREEGATIDYYFNPRLRLYWNSKHIETGQCWVYFPPNDFEQEVTEALRVELVPLASKYPYGSEIIFHDDGVQTGTVVGWEDDIIVVGIGDNYKGISEHQVATQKDFDCEDFVRTCIEVLRGEAIHGSPNIFIKLFNSGARFVEAKDEGDAQQNDLP